jgi:two-component system OmpR family sensor kinase
VASLASFTRSAAQATSSAYRRLPIRWRLAGGSAVLTLVILCGFATIVGVLTVRRLHGDFDQQVSQAADELQRSLELKVDYTTGDVACQTTACPIANLTDYAAPQRAIVRIVTLDGDAVKKSQGAPFLGVPGGPQTRDFGPYRVESRPLRVTGLTYGTLYVQYARRRSDVDATAARVRFFLALGVLGGAALALLAGLATARRAMSPIAELTETARQIARTRDPSVHIPRSEADDEVSLLAATLEEMLRSLDEARSDTESALARQREFVADASHELRTPLTSVLANLELLEEELAGEQRDTAASALRSTRRMRRLVADLLLLARADAGRAAPHRPVDLSRIVVEAAAELEPVADEHELMVDAPAGMIVDGARDELHRLVLNLLENAVKHTARGTPIRATVRHDGDGVRVTIEDEGPGVPPELRGRMFDRFVRGAADRGGSSGLGLSIVRAVAVTHGGTVKLEDPPSGRGARFVVRLPAGARDRAESAQLPVT